MAVAMVQIAHSYGFPVYINVGLTDAKLPDAQAGAEKAVTLLLGVLAGADTFGHCGICGTDHAGSLLWLAFDDELMSYVKRIARGFAVDAEHLATDVIHSVGPAGNSWRKSTRSGTSVRRCGCRRLCGHASPTTSGRAKAQPPLPIGCGDV